ncbi:MAG: YeeE/YedE family protein [Pseudomonadota bacterium]
MQKIAALLAGLLFGWGLLLSGMTDPSKVQGFLNLAGPWDPSLGLVMLGAILVAAPAFAWARHRKRSLLGAPIQIPVRTVIDGPLVFGSVSFGLGWGLAGFCPGPALVSASEGHLEAFIFVAAMLVGMSVHTLLNLRSHRLAQPPGA